MLFATSCQDDLGINGGDASMVEFVVTTPEIATRAYSDGQTATELQYAVYKSNGTILGDLTKAVALNNAEEIHGSTKVNLKLTTGNTYTVVFWAAEKKAPYIVDFGANLADANMKVRYSDAKSNDEGRDAFYAVETFTVTGAQTETIELRRPFAQINIGTADYADSQKAGYTPTMSAVTVKNLGDQLNFATGEVSGKTEERVFGEALIDKNETFPVTGYEYLAMNYVLVDTVKGLVDVEFTYTDGKDAKTRTVGSVPVKRNYRTNIYGQLLTSDVDINVEIVPEYNKPDHEAEALYVAAACGGEVTLTQDVVLPSNLVFYADAVIDLNGFSITGGKVYVAGVTSGTDISAITVDNGARLTIKGEGTVTGTEYGVYVKKGEFTAKSGYYTANSSSVQISNGTLNIEGGKYSITDDKDYTINCINSDWNAGRAIVNITGGKFDGFNPAETKSEGGIANFCADGYTAVAKDGWYYVVADDVDVLVASGDELRGAIANATTETGIKLMPGVYEGLFDVTGKDLMLTGDATIKGLVWAYNSNVTLKGLTLTNPNGVQYPNPTNSKYFASINEQYPLVAAYVNTDITFENCTFDIVGPTVYGFYGYSDNDPKFYDCTFKCNGIRPIANNGDSIVVDGCTFEDQYHYSVRIFENSGEKQTVVYTNNVVKGTNAKGEFEGVNISKKGSSAVVLGDFTIKGNTKTLKYRHHKNVTMSENCTYSTDIANFAFEKEQ